MTSTREQLKEAYRLIRQDQPAAAQQIIRPILAEDPENVHAWWLLAYSVDDPYEVRDALNKVLELDPNYSNAPKAREMLRTLDEQFFSAQTETDEAASPSDEAGEFETDLGGTFDYDESSAEGETFFEEEESFLADYDETVFDPAASEEDVYTGYETEEPERDPLEDMFDTPGYAELSEEEKAAAEERAGARSGRGRRILAALLFVAILAAIAVGAFLLLQEDDDAGTDPAALAAVEPQSEPVSDALAAARNDVSAAGVGAEQDAVIAETDLGQTLFVQFCREPSRELPQDIAFAMQIAVQHAAEIADEIDAVGVSVDRCDAEDHDTLYRAFVPLDDALIYVIGVLGSADTAWPEFQRRWQKP